MLWLWWFHWFNQQNSCLSVFHKIEVPLLSVGFLFFKNDHDMLGSPSWRHLQILLPIGMFFFHIFTQIHPIRFIRWVNHQLSHSYPGLGEKQPWKRIFQQFIIYVVNLSPISTMKQPVIFWAFGFPCRYPSFKCCGDFWIFNTMVTAPWCRSQMGL